MRLRKICTGLFTLGISFSLLFQTPVMAAEETSGDTSVQDTVAGITTNSIPGWPQGADITSTAAVVMEDSTNTILYAKNMDQPLYPGSAVKIMTTLLALENSQLSDEVTMTQTGVSGVTDGGANISAQLDEVFTMEQCLYAIMVASANDIALQVAEHIGGSVEAFVEKMNTRAKELGCTNTVFTNPTGLPDENQHITAHDMALIMKAAISNESFRTIASTPSYTIPATNVSGGERALTNNFSMISAGNAAYYQECIGGKEGFTDASGSTIVCAASRNDMTLIAVVLQGAQGQTAAEAGALLDYGFQNFQMRNLGDTDFNVISGGTVVAPAGISESDITSEDTPAEDGNLKRTYLYQGNVIGTATAMASQEQDDTMLIRGEKNMTAAKDFSAGKTYVPYYVIGGVGIVLLILLILWIVRIAKA